MSVDLVATAWAQEQFGDDAAEVTERVVRAILAAHQSSLDAQHASGLEKRFPYGSVWQAKFDNLVAELRDMPGAEIIRVPKASYCLVKLQGKLFVPFRHASRLGVPLSQAKIESTVLRDLAALSVPRPPREPNLFDSADEEADGVGAEQPADAHASMVRDDETGDDTSVLYIGYAANADSPSVLAAWWGIGQAQAEDGTVTWSPEPLPLHIVGSGKSPAGVPQPQTADQVFAFDQGPVPLMEVTARPRPVEASEAGEGRQDGHAAADDRE